MFAYWQTVDGMARVAQGYGAGENINTECRPMKHVSEHAIAAITRILYEQASLEEADHAMDALKRAAGEDEWRPLSPHHQSATAPVLQLFESQFQQAPSSEEQPNPRDLPEATRAHEG